MREILFRGKSKFGSWHYGFYTEGYYLDGTPVSWIDEVDRKKKQTDSPTVIPETVGQFTGRIDKNGKKVFEHDILQTFIVRADGTVEKCGVGIVQWWENDQCYVLTTKEGYHIDDFGNYGRPEYYEVIGNIHDNPNLVET